MLQRSPTYMMTRPETTKWAGIFRRLLPVGISHRIGRWWNLRLSQVFYQLSREKPDKIRKFLLDGVRNELGEDYDIDKHFSPSYAPWDQRVCLVRNNDLFDAINSGSVSVVTGHIESFTASGVRLFSGEELPADIIVTATGLDLKVMGGTELIVDGSPVNPAETFTYKGMMNSDVPNLISTFGYVTASWTLRSDLIGEFTCRLINYMDNKRLRMCTPRLRESDRGMSVRPFIDSFTSNYIQRGSRLMPMQGDHEPWIYTQDYQQDQQRMLNAPLDDGALVFE
jgi:cation diffusion facilitator CzcD-associated flavoprotein CzcO